MMEWDVSLIAASTEKHVKKNKTSADCILKLNYWIHTFSKKYTFYVYDSPNKKIILWVQLLDYSLTLVLFFCSRLYKCFPGHDTQADNMSSGSQTHLDLTKNHFEAVIKDKLDH